MPTEKTKKMPVSDDEGRMTFTEHLKELRTRIIRSLMAVAVCTLIVCLRYNDIFELISRPFKQSGIKWITMSPFEPIFVMLRLSLYGGITLAFPVILYQACAFIFPGLTRKEKRAVQFMLSCGLILALAGVSLAYFGIFPVAVPHMMKLFTPVGVTNQLHLSETLPQILLVLLGFAIAFQFPMLLMILVYLDLVKPQSLLRHWRYWMVGIAFAATIFVPPDPFSLLMLTIPLWLLYWLSVLGAFVIVRKRDKPEPPVSGLPAPPK